MKHLLEPAYVLHYRPYRDTSLLVDFFTRDHGLIGAVARGVRGAKSPLKGLLQPFVPLLISFQAKGDLALITGVEPNQTGHLLVGKHLFSALYLNELLMRLLQRHDPHPQIYASYRQALLELSHCNRLEIPLRRFEKKLISELGYALNLTTEANTHEPIAPELFYQFFSQKGFLLDYKGDSSKASLFQGKSLLALAEEDFSDLSLMHDMKGLLRTALADLLGKQPLKSRDLFV